MGGSSFHLIQAFTHTHQAARPQFRGARVRHLLRGAPEYSLLRPVRLHAEGLRQGVEHCQGWSDRRGRFLHSVATWYPIHDAARPFLDESQSLLPRPQQRRLVCWWLVHFVGSADPSAIIGNADVLSHPPLCPPRAAMAICDQAPTAGADCLWFHLRSDRSQFA